MKHFARFRFGCIEPLEARVAPALILAVTGTDLTTAVPGDSGKVSYTLTNTGTQATTGKSGVHILFGGVVIEEFPDQSVAVPANTTKLFTASFDLPPLSLPFPSPDAGSKTISVQYVQLGQTKQSPAFNYVFQFGQVGDRSGVKLPYSDSDGTEGNFIVSGKGTGTLSVGSGLVDFTVTGSDDNTKAGVTGKGGIDGRVQLHHITTNAPLSQLNLVAANVSGNLNVTGGASAIGIGDIGGGTTFAIGPKVAGKPVKMKLGKVHDIAITSQDGIDLMQVVDWQNSNGNVDSVTAPFLTKLDVTGDKSGAPGDFEASLNLSGSNAKGLAIDNATAAGVLGGTWTVTGATNAVRKIVADGASQWKLLADARVDTIEIKGDLLGDKNAAAIRALNFDDINVAGTLAIYIEATGKDAKDNFALENLKARKVDGATVKAPAGGMGKIDVGEWVNGGLIQTQFVKSLETDGRSGVGDFDANLTIAPPAQLPSGIKAALAKAVIKGALKAGTGSTTWDIDGVIDNLTADSIGSNWTLAGVQTAGVAATTVNKLEIKGANAGVMRIFQLEKGEVGGDFSGTFDAGNSIHELHLAKVVAGHVTATKFLGELTAWQWDGGSITTGTTSGIQITGNKKASLPGNLTNVSITTNGAGADDYLNELKVAGGMASVDIDASTNVGVISADDWTSGRLTARSLGNLNLTGSANTRGDLNNVNINLTSAFGAIPDISIAGSMDQSTLTTQANVQHITVGGMRASTITCAKEIEFFEVSGNGVVPAPLFVDSNVNAASFKTVLVREVGPSSITSGFSADKIANYTRIANGVSTILSNLDIAGDFDNTAFPNYRVHIT